MESPIPLVLFRVIERIAVITFLAFLLKLLAYNKAVPVSVNVCPAQAEDFGLAHTGENIEEEQIVQQPLSYSYIDRMKITC